MALAYAASQLARAGRGGALTAQWRLLRTSASAWQAEPKPVPLSKLKDSFNDGTSISYIEELEKRYLADPASVDRTWASFFKSMGE